MILFFTTITVVPLMLVFAGMAIDLTALGELKTRAQVAVDAGATAGAASIRFVKDVPECTKDCTGNWTLNTDVPRAYSALNGFANPDVTFDPAAPGVTVSVTSSIGTSFLRLIGITQLNTAASAKAVRKNIEQAVKDAEPPVPGRSALVK